MPHIRRVVLALAALIGLSVAFTPTEGQVLGSLVQNDLQAYMAGRSSSFQNVTKFSFGVYSDIHMIEAADWGLTRTQWQGLLRQWRDAGHLFGMIVGDLGYGNTTDVSNVLSGPAAVPDAPPVFFAMGNHELDGIGKRPWIDALYPGAVRAGSWTALSGLSPGNGDHVYYSFDVGPYTHFIVLDGDYMTLDGLDPRRWQTFGQRQLAWLQADIKANANRNILVFVHEPIDQQVSGSTPDYTSNDKGSLIDLLAAHPKQSVIFSGHLHSLRGITRWKGITSVHVMTTTSVGYGLPLIYGPTVSIDGEQIIISNAGSSTDFDLHVMNQVLTSGNEQVVRVAEDGANSGGTRSAAMTVVGPENGVVPTSGSLMLKGPAVTWYAPRFISEQLIKIRPGMKFSFDISLANVVNGDDAVTVQPYWYMKDGSLPPKVVDGNNLQLSQRPRDGMFFLYNNDVPRMNGLATNRWYRREFDLSPLAGNYVDGVYLTQAAGRVNVGAVYVDNIRFSWPATTSANIPPTVAITSPSAGSTFTAPATVVLTAAATDTDGTVASVTYYAGATQLGASTVSPYTVTWANVLAGTYTVTAIARDNGGATTTSTPVTVSVAAAPSTGASATFLGIDSTSRGNWKGVYGTQGYMIANDSTIVPSYATVRQSGSSSWTWANSTADTRALTKAGASDRIAATWFGSTMEFEINLLDGQMHRLAMYLLDWDLRGRAESVEVLDGATGTVLDTRAASAFSDGQYFVWNVKGRVLFRVRLTAGANAVYSAVFLDPPSGTSGTGSGTSSTGKATATFVGTDTTTAGNWKGTYGAAGYAIANDGTSLPSYAVVAHRGALWTWSPATSDVRALQKSASTDRIASTWFAYSPYEMDVNLTDSLQHKVSMYTVDWDQRGRAQAIQVLDAVSGAVLDTRAVSNFSSGQYWSWMIGGHVIFRVTPTAGPNAVYSGVFVEN